MKAVKILIVYLLASLSGNKFIQNVLKKTVYLSQYFMGIGSGTNVLLSGEKQIFKELSNRCQPPFLIFDIGANQGQFTELALQSLKTEKLQIHAFEPGSRTFQILSETIQNPSVRLINTGIGKTCGEMTLYYNSEGSGLASLTKRNLDHFNIDFNLSETVQITTIDDYCRENQVEKINLLKIDIEGHELDALAGAEKMFQKNVIDIVTFEFGGSNIDTRTSFRDFWNFFKKVNMEIFRITPSGYLCHIKSYNELDEQYRTTNFIAFK